MKITTVGLDIVKQVFQVHAADSEGRALLAGGEALAVLPSSPKAIGAATHPGQLSLGVKLVGAAALCALRKAD